MNIRELYLKKEDKRKKLENLGMSGSRETGLRRKVRSTISTRPMLISLTKILSLRLNTWKLLNKQGQKRTWTLKRASAKHRCLTLSGQSCMSKQGTALIKTIMAG